MTVAASSAHDQAHVYAGLFHWQMGNAQAAKDAFRAALTMNARCTGAMVGMGWVELTLNLTDPASSKKALEWFEKALDHNDKNVEVSIPVASCSRHTRCLCRPSWVASPC